MFLIIVNGIDFGLGIQYPKGIPDSIPHAIQMQSIIDALEKYNKVDGIISIFSLASSGIFWIIAKVKGISLWDGN